MEYSITGKNTYKVEFTTRPYGANEYATTPECIAKDGNEKVSKNPYRHGIPISVAVTVEMAENEDLKNVPKCIMSHAVKDINVLIAGTLRPLTSGDTYEKKYDSLKAKLSKPLTFTATVEAAKKGAREKISPTGKVIDRLLKAYGAERVAPHIVAIAKEIDAGANEQDTVLKYATMLEAAALKKQK